MGIQLNTIRGQAQVLAANANEIVSNGLIKLTSAGAANGCRLSFLTGFVGAAATGHFEHGPGANLWESVGTAAIGAAAGTAISGADANANTLTVTSHGFTNGQSVAVYSTGDYPTGITSDLIYYVEVVDASTVRLHKYSPRPTGQLVSISDAGTSAVMVPVSAHTVSVNPVADSVAPLFGAARARIAAGAGEVQVLAVIIAQGE